MLGLSQLILDFTTKPAWSPLRHLRDDAPPPEPAKAAIEAKAERDAELEAQARGWLEQLDLPGMARLLSVEWNPRLRSTAGYAHYTQCRVELNPRLREFEGQVERTLKHELAHLVAHHRAGRRRIEPHGAEWRAACADLGIPDERARHSLPLPRNEVERKFIYICPQCRHTVRRARKFRSARACLSCCNSYAGGKFDVRFKFKLVVQDDA